jgi:hypothetical protein
MSIEETMSLVKDQEIEALRNEVIRLNKIIESMKINNILVNDPVFQKPISNLIKIYDL